MKRALPWLGIVLLVRRRRRRLRRGGRSTRCTTSRSTAWPACARPPASRSTASRTATGSSSTSRRSRSPIAPLALLPPVAARAVWFFLTARARRRARQPVASRCCRTGGGRPRSSSGSSSWRWASSTSGRSASARATLLLAVLVLAAVAPWRGGRDAAAGALLAAATIVKPYAILFLPYLGGAPPVERRRELHGGRDRGRPAARRLRYGWAGNLGQLHGWWTTVTTSTAPNLAGQDNVSIAGMYAAWLGRRPGRRLAGRRDRRWCWCSRARGPSCGARGWRRPSTSTRRCCCS